jgi:type II secretory pathway component PulL
VSQVDGGFAPTFKEAVGRWRRRHRHPPPNETWFAVHYRLGWLVEKLTFLESVHLLRQGLDVRPLSSERPPKRRKDARATEVPDEDEEEGIQVEDEPRAAANQDSNGG